jgi:hypothetical protein
LTRLIVNSFIGNFFSAPEGPDQLYCFCHLGLAFFIGGPLGGRRLTWQAF